jgi:DeoR family lactose phosphotransferase system repressor
LIKKERQDAILSTLNRKQFCSVSELAKQLYVAPITVRRDLMEMEASGLLKRCHGGASVVDYANREVPYELRSRENASAKARIAKKAVHLIHHGDTVFLDASTTVAHMADYIDAQLELTIITNSIRVLEKLRGKGMRCYLTGGMLLENSSALVGRIAEDAVSALYADICFFSSQGITDEGIITDFSEDETRLRKCMLANAKKKIFLYDQSKLGKQFLFKVCSQDELTAVITDLE